MSRDTWDFLSLRLSFHTIQNHGAQGTLPSPKLCYFIYSNKKKDHTENRAQPCTVIRNFPFALDSWNSLKEKSTQMSPLSCPIHFVLNIFFLLTVFVRSVAPNSSTWITSRSTAQENTVCCGVNRLPGIPAHFEPCLNLMCSFRMSVFLFSF